MVPLYFKTYIWSQNVYDDLQIYTYCKRACTNHGLSDQFPVA